MREPSKTTSATARATSTGRNPMALSPGTRGNSKMGSWTARECIDPLMVSRKTVSGSKESLSSGCEERHLRTQRCREPEDTTRILGSQPAFIKCNYVIITSAEAHFPIL